DSKSSPDLIRYYFLLRQWHTVHAHWNLVITPAALIRALLVVVLHPRIEIGLPLLQRPIDLFPERDAIELVQHGLVESLIDPVGRRFYSVVTVAHKNERPEEIC